MSNKPVHVLVGIVLDDLECVDAWLTDGAKCQGEVRLIKDPYREDVDNEVRVVAMCQHHEQCARDDI